MNYFCKILYKGFTAVEKMPMSMNTVYKPNQMQD